MFHLEQLVSVVKKRKRIGRGGSRGGTSGKGHKGQKSRSGGKVAVGFEGGQMPLYRRLPKRGFNNTRFRVPVQEVNVGVLEAFFTDGDTINRALLIERGVISPRKSKGRFLVKLLGGGSITKKLTVHVDRCSASASEMIAKAGGQVVREEG